MGLMDKVKNLASTNKDKIATGVDKATDAIDKKTAGKYADKLRKVDDAAAKYAGSRHDDAPASPQAPPTTDH